MIDCLFTLHAYHIASLSKSLTSPFIKYTKKGNYKPLPGSFSELLLWISQTQNVKVLRETQIW